MEANNVRYVSASVIICESVHGQFYDLLEILKIEPMPECNYIFLGNYMSIGFYSAETFELLLALKVKYHQCLTILQGNHESRNRTMEMGCMMSLSKSTAIPIIGNISLMYLTI